MHGSRTPLEEALRAATVPLVSGKKAGTGFFVTTDLVLTSAHVLNDPAGPVTAPSGHRFEVLPDTYFPGTGGLVLLRSLDERSSAPVQLGEPAEPGDQLLTYGYPDDHYRSGDSALLELEGYSERDDGTVLLRTARGRVRPGNSGGPALNWRTGAVCGVVQRRDSRHGETARLVPASTIFECYPFLRVLSVPWLDLLDDGQLAALGVAYPGPLMRRYLRAAAVAGDEHPYAAVLDATPPLSKVYLRQHAGDGTGQLAFADDLVRDRLDVQVTGDPGAGKSSLVRHLTAVEANRWLSGERGAFVPVPVPATALQAAGGLPDQLARGVTGMLDLDLDHATLAALFSRPPMPGVPWLLLVDGVDEVLNLQERSMTLNRVDRHRVSGHRILVTSRPLSATDAQRGSSNGRYPYFEISPFDSAQFRAFTEAWFTELGVEDPGTAAARFVDRIHRSKLAELAKVPLTATMMCVLHARDPDQDVPVSRAELYDRFVALLARRRGVVGVHELVSQWIGRGTRKAESTTEDLLDHLHAVLAKLAHDNLLHRVTGPLPERAAAVFADRGVHRPESVPVDEWTNVLREVLRSCGLLVEKPAGFSFIHQTMEEYLAAGHLAEDQPSPVRQLQPRDDWLSPELEIHLFLAARLLRDGVDIDRVLLRMLKRRNRRANLGFVLELERQGVRLTDKVRRQLRQVLVTQIGDESITHAEWRAACEALRNIDEPHAAEVLRTLATSRATFQRRLRASTFLLGLRPETGLSVLEEISGDPRLSGADRLLAARALVDADAARGVRSLVRLAEELAGTDLGLEVARAVADLDEDRGLGLLSRAASTRSKGSVRLTAARSLATLDTARGLSALTVLVRDQRASQADRLAAAVAMEDCAAGASFPFLSELALDPAIEASIRIAAAGKLAGWGQLHGLESLVRIAFDRTVAVQKRLEATAKLAEVSPQHGHEVRMQLTADPTVGEQRLDLAEITGPIDPAGTARTLARLADEEQAEGVVRLHAASTALDFVPAEGLAALERLARAKVETKVRLEAAGIVAEEDFARGGPLLRELAENQLVDFSSRVVAAEQLYEHDSEQGRAALNVLGNTPGLDAALRLRLGERILGFDKALGVSLISSVAQHGAGALRLDALAKLHSLRPVEALELYEDFIKNRHVSSDLRQRALQRLTPAQRAKIEKSIARQEPKPSRRQQMKNYQAQSQNRKLEPEERVTAAESMAQLDSAKGRAALEALAEDDRMSKAARRRAEKSLRRLR
ncbi:trypsin-like peptidase domain-containing protein [Amycolatopsis magusensis]|uniref:Trypsin-like peptidase domain-containing protein n=1 Tax=Amycolatopsis magusensis TaxID=882444 RepID=A0ABS4PYH7_9PSEU|nr:trypsin-like peptidase domain-containing protein [Amycolatopsis magusensis]MBP2184497.1 hypothetical protein [Amycolatopsis magusensis]